MTHIEEALNRHKTIPFGVFMVLTVIFLIWNPDPPNEDEVAAEQQTVQGE